VWTAGRKSESGVLFFTHLASATVARTTAQVTTNTTGNPVTRKGFRDHISLKFKYFFSYSPPKNILLAAEREKHKNIDM
jgi:hypothetical protein